MSDANNHRTREELRALNLADLREEYQAALLNTTDVLSSLVLFLSELSTQAIPTIQDYTKIRTQVSNDLYRLTNEVIHLINVSYETSYKAQFEIRYLALRKELDDEA